MQYLTANKLRAFTLIELLVLAVISAILAALLLPLLTKARERGRRASCMCNTKQFALGIGQFYDDQKPNQMPRRTSVQDLFIDIAPYIGYSANVAVCPSSCDKVADSVSDIHNAPNGCSYTFNSSKVWQDADLAPLAWDRVLPSYPPKPGALWVNNLQHKEGGNILWTDGHADWNTSWLSSELGSAWASNVTVSAQPLNP